jgi:NAD-dependent SIR2 family protein deacetylase
VRPSVRRKVSRVPLIPSTPVRTERCAAVLSGAQRCCASTAAQRCCACDSLEYTVRPNVLTYGEAYYSR